MSRFTETTVTVTLDDDERDVLVRAYVVTGPGLGMGGGWGAEIDGGLQLQTEGEWTDIEDVPLGAIDIERIEDALCDLALENVSEVA